MPSNPDRWMKHEWARELRNACQSADVAFFFKQVSGVRTEMGNRLIEADGSETVWEQFPDHRPSVAAPLRLAV